MSFTGFFQNVTDVVGNFLKVTCKENLHCNTNQFLEAANACGVSFQSALEAAWNTCANFCRLEMNYGNANSVPSLGFFSTSDSVCDDSNTVQCLATELDSQLDLLTSSCPPQALSSAVGIIAVVILITAILAFSTAACGVGIKHLWDKRKGYTPITDATPDDAPSELSPLSRV